jgi:hypothetical protein
VQTENDHAPSVDRLAALLRRSLALWRVEGTLDLVRADLVVTTPGGEPLVVRRVRGRGGLPAWALARGDGPAQEHAAAPALLRAMRGCLDPGHVPGRALAGRRPEPPEAPGSPDR